MNTLAYTHHYAIPKCSELTRANAVIHVTAQSADGGWILRNVNFNIKFNCSINKSYFFGNCLLHNLAIM